MSYRVLQDGTIEADTAEEAIALARLLDSEHKGRAKQRSRKPGGEDKRNNAKTSKGKAKQKSRNLDKPGGEDKRNNTKASRTQCSFADKYNVRIGQLYKKRGGSSRGRIIQVYQLLQDGVMPKIIKNTPGITRKGVAKTISYATLFSAYKLIKDI